MQTVTADVVEGRAIRSVLGLVTGHVVERCSSAPPVGVGQVAELRRELEALDRARVTARRRLEEAAAALGADAVVRVRFASTSLGTEAVEVLASGTAVTLAGAVRSAPGGPSLGERYSMV